jgi:small neutral amino acid transporter SnatA (MarC family)
LLVQLFFFLLSFGDFSARFLYAFSDDLASKTLFAQELSNYPPELRENRQRRKNVLNTSILVLIAMLFNLTLSYLGFHITDYEGTKIPR